MRWATRAQHPGRECEDTRCRAVREMFVMRRKDDGVTRAASLVDTGDHRAIRVDRRAEVDEVQLSRNIGRGGEKLSDVAVVAHSIGRRRECGFAEPAQLAGLGLEQTSRAEHERRLPRPGRPNNRDRLARLDLQVDAAKNFSRGETGAGADAEALAKRAKLEGERHADR